jgi:hypothetical protein
MKRVFLFLVVVLLSAPLFAQQPYNGGFELWYSPTNPDGWGTWASTVVQYNGPLGDSLVRLAMKDSLDFPVGNAHDSTSVRMSVDTCTFPTGALDTLAGFISYGGAFYNTLPDTPVGLQFGYYPYAAYPDSLIFDYKYIPVAGDNGEAYVGMTMNRYDSATAAEVIYLNIGWLLPAASSWTHMAFTLPYQNRDTFLPDSIQIIFITSISQPLHPGTTLWLDTVHFDASVNIIDSLDTLGLINIQNTRGVSAYPNPAGQQLHILVQAGDVGSGIELYDVSGRQAYSGRVSSTDYTIDTQVLPDGIYTLRVHSTDRITVYSGRVTVVHSQ